jgi:tetratricopeptide (TPR) repeat protein
MSDAFAIDISMSASLPRARRVTAPGASLPWLLEQVERGAEARVGGFALQKILGEGETGVVFAADDLERGGQVALRLLRAPDRNAGPGERALLRTAQEIARLDHPNVVRVHEVGEADGHLFVAMELLTGPELPQWLRAQSRGWRDKLAVFVPIGRGLQAAHEAGIVHGDFSLHSVRFAADERPCVLDFGNGRARNGETDARTGMLAYTAPELLRKRNPDARSDQYAFCVALYEALYGAPPFKADDRLSLLATIAAGRLPPPPSRDVPPWLHAVLARGLATDPKQRYPSLAALLDELATRSARRTRRWFALAGVVALAGLAAFHTVDRRAHEAARERRCDAAGELSGAWSPARRESVLSAISGSSVAFAEDTAPRVAARLDDYAAQWSALSVESCHDHRSGDLSERDHALLAACLEQRRRDLSALTTALADADDAAVTSAVAAAFALRPLSACTDTAGLRSEVDPPEPKHAAEVDRLREQLSTPRAELLAGRPSRARELLIELLPAVERTGYRPLRAEALLLAGLVEDALGDPKFAAARLEEALWDAEGSRHDAVAAEAAVHLVRVTGKDLGQPDAAALWERHARAAFDRRGGPRELDVLWQSALAELALQIGALPTARDYLENALESAERTLGPTHFDVAMLHARLGALAGRLDDHRRAREHLDEALSRVEALLGPDHPTVAAILADAGADARTRGDLVEAQAYFERALVLHERTAPEARREAARLSGELAALHMGQGHYAVARHHLEKTLALRQGDLDSPELAPIEADLAEACLRVHDLDAARDHLGRALDGLRATLGERHPRTLAAAALAGRIELELGKTRAGIATLEHALATMTATEGVPRADLGVVRFALARTLVAGRNGRARALALAREATGDFAAAGRERELAEVRTWLKSQEPVTARAAR